MSAAPAPPPVLVCEPAPPRFLADLEADALPGVRPRVHYRPQLAADRTGLERAAAKAAAVVVRNGVRVDGRLLARARALRVVGRLGAGLDNIDVAAARRRGVQVVYAPWAGSASTAEHALALILALARGLTRRDRECRAGVWRRAADGLELQGLSLGILGYGAVGRHLARAAAGLGLQVLTHHPRRPPEHPDLSAAGVRWTDEETLLRRAQVLSVHLPERPETRGYLDEARLRLLPRGALLVNTGRGAALSETALARLLGEGRLGGAALDVREREPPPRPDPLAHFENVILTPHIAGLTARAQRRLGAQVAADVRRVLAGLPPQRPAPC